MAKHVILESYAFTPSTNTIVVSGKNIRREQLLLVTNVTRGTVIYNFSDPTLGASSYTNGVNSVTGLETTTIVTSYSTSAMSSTDKLSILVEETYNEITPAETFMDPVGKMRVSQPQSLIDTDFEYGTQPTKWESITKLNNRPSAFYDVTNPVNGAANSIITNITASTNLVTVTLSSTTGVVAGQAVFVTGTLDQANADGWWLVETVTSNTSFTYRTLNNPAAALWDSAKTYVYTGTFYTGAGIPTTSITVSTPAVGYVTIVTTAAHGLSVGNHVFISGTTGATGVINGTWSVYSTPTNNSFVIACTATGTITLTAGASATLYIRAQGYVLHRAFDGGVQFTNQLPYHGYQVIRQTRRYFRYQSGKGIQFSTGSILKPALNVDSITASGTTITVTCKYPHGVAAGSQIQVSGCNESAYNGIFTVVSTATVLSFTYTALTTPSSTPATASNLSSFTISPYAWYGSRNRIGMFDQQNGFFYEFDGQTLWAVKRSSTTQVSGTGAVTANTNTVTGTNSYFSSQLKPGDMIVIRGMSYTVMTIVSDTSMQIYPEYRGATIANAVISKTIDQKYPQSQWNIDKMDGSGQSLYNIDLTKMQMFYCDFTWYGAGAIRFGFKNNRGEVIYCHRIPNNNVNTEAYMRSGNLPARYETNTFSYYTFLTATLSNTATTGATISGADFANWPNAGTAILTASGATSAAIEYVSYTAKSQAVSLTGTLTNGSTTIQMSNTSGVATGQYINGTGIQPNTIVSSIVANSSITISQPVTVTGSQTLLFAPSLVIGARAQLGGNTTAQTFTYSATAPIQLAFYSPSQASTISHWGSSVIMDGRFDDDKSYVFQAGMTTSLTNIAQNGTVALMSLRLAPSVDSGLTGLMGAREIMNRMQLTMRQMDCLTTGTGAYFLIKLVLNGRVNTTTGNTFAPVGGSSLSQVCYHAAATTVTGGETIFSFFTNSAAVTQQDLSLVRDLGTSIISGGNTLSASVTPNNVYPDGPDVVTITATNVTAVATNSIQGRISWTEAQA